MKKMLRLFFFPLFLLPASYASAMPYVLSLEKALEISLSTNKEIAQAHSQEEAVRFALASKKGLYYPLISMKGQYTRLNAPLSLDINNIKDALIASNSLSAAILGATPAQQAALSSALKSALPAFEMGIQDQDYFNLSLNASYVLYAGGRIKAANAAKAAELEAAIRNTKAAEEKIRAEVTEKYYALKLAAAAAQIRHMALNSIKRHDEKGAFLERKGLLSRAGRLRFAVALADAEREEKKAKRKEALAAIMLSNLLSISASSFTLTTDFPKPQLPKKELESYITEALASNSLLNSLSYAKKQLQSQSIAINAKRLPTLAAFGRYELYKHDLTLLEPDYAGGFILDIPIFSGFSDYRESLEIKAKINALARLTESCEQQIRALVNKYHHDMLSAIEEYAALEKTMALAEESLRLCSISFEQGAATSLEVIDARLSLDKAKLQRSGALYDYAKSRALLERICGQY